MRRFTFAALVAIALAPLPVTADPAADLDYIVEQTLTERMFRGAIEAQRPVLVSAIENDLRKVGITISDNERFFDIFIEEFILEFVETMREETKVVYLRNFSEEEIVGIAAFYRTAPGRALLANAPAMMQAGAQIGRLAGAQAGANASRRLAERLEREGIVIDNNPSLTQRLIEQLRP